MGQWTDEVNNAPVSRVAPWPGDPERQDSLVYAPVRSGELPAAQFGGRGIWRVRESDLAAYIDGAFAKTAERIAAGQIPQDHVT